MILWRSLTGRKIIAALFGKGTKRPAEPREPKKPPR